MSTETSLGLLVASVSNLILEVRRLCLEVRSLQLLVEDRLGPRDHLPAGPPAEDPALVPVAPASPDRAFTPLAPASSASPARVPAGTTAAPAAAPTGQLTNAEHRNKLGRLVSGSAGPWRRTIVGPKLAVSTSWSFGAAKFLVTPAGYIGDRVVFVGFPTQLGGESSAEEAERPPELRYVLAGSTFNYDYEIGALAVGDGEARRTISVILVAPFEERMLAIFPSKAWDKKPNKRKLPSGPFTKPVLVEVACASPFDRTTLSSEGPAKVWFGMLARQLAEQDSRDGPLGAPILPYEVAGLDPAMVRAAFVTAGELRELGALMQKGARASVITQLLSLSPCWEKARSLEAAKKLPAKGILVPAREAEPPQLSQALFKALVGLSHLLGLRPLRAAGGAARIQHMKLDDTTAMEYVLAVWENLPGRAPLYPGSPSAYRRRWDRLLQMLAVPATAGITPAIRLRTARYAAAGGSENAAP
ncbi:unnamed protein product [Symbiodinium sp. KB8]|nr:unnamed protein product [Symbiodinium sp. KB8]